MWMDTIENNVTFSVVNCSTTADTDEIALVWTGINVSETDSIAFFPNEQNWVFILQTST